MVAVAVSLLGCADDSDGTAPPLQWDACQRWECARLDVPLSYDEPDGEAIELGLLRIEGDKPAAGVMMFNPGGPGIATLPQADVMEGFFDIVAPHHDVVLVDNRGVGQSAAIDCVELDAVQGLRFIGDIESETQLREQQRIVEAVIEGCVQTVGSERLQHLGTLDVARDMDRVRDALGADRVSFVGGSYGSVQGMAYAQLFPDRVDTFMLDAPVAPHPDRIAALRDRGRSYERELGRFLEWCGQSDACEFHGGQPGEPARGFDELLARLDDGQVVVDGEVQRRSLLLGAVDSALFFGDWVGLGAALASAEADDWDAFAAQKQAADPRRNADAMRLRFVWEMIRSVDYGCPANFGPAELYAEIEAARAELPRMGAQQYGIEGLWCLAWPSSFTPQPVRLESTSAPAMLLLSGDNDPATPLWFGEAVRDGLANGSHLLRWGGEGHTVAPNSPCAVDVMAAFVADPFTLPALRCDD